MDLNLKGKVALVTGGGRDTGGQIAETLAAEGAIVAVNYRKSKDEADAVVSAIETAGGQARAYQADIGHYDQVTAMVDRIGRRFRQHRHPDQQRGLCRLQEIHRVDA